MSTSWHSRRALGRGHSPITRSPSVTVKRPSSLTRRTSGLAAGPGSDWATAPILSLGIGGRPASSSSFTLPPVYRGPFAQPSALILGWEFLQGFSTLAEVLAASVPQRVAGRCEGRSSAQGSTITYGAPSRALAAWGDQSSTRPRLNLGKSLAQCDATATSPTVAIMAIAGLAIPWATKEAPLVDGSNGASAATVVGVVAGVEAADITVFQL